MFPQKITIILLAIRKINKYHWLYTNCRRSCPLNAPPDPQFLLMLPHACTENAAKTTSLSFLQHFSHGSYWLREVDTQYFDVGAGHLCLFHKDVLIRPTVLRNDLPPGFTFHSITEAHCFLREQHVEHRLGKDNAWCWEAADDLEGFTLKELYYLT